MSLEQCQPLSRLVPAHTGRAGTHTASLPILWLLVPQAPSSHRQHISSRRLIQGSTAASLSEVSLPQLPAAHAAYQDAAGTRSCLCCRTVIAATYFPDRNMHVQCGQPSCRQRTTCTSWAERARLQGSRGPVPPHSSLGLTDVLCPVACPCWGCHHAACSPLKYSSQAAHLEKKTGVQGVLEEHVDQAHQIQDRASMYPLPKSRVGPHHGRGRSLDDRIHCSRAVGALSSHLAVMEPAWDTRGTCI